MSVKLRLLEPEDLDNLLKIENDSQYWHLSGTKKPFTKDELSNYIQNANAEIVVYSQLRFVIEFENQFSGLVDLFEYDEKDKKAGVGIILLENFRGNGIALKALELLKVYCLKNKLINKLSAIIETDNTKSIRLFIKSDFKETATLSDYLVKGNQKVDCINYELTL